MTVSQPLAERKRSVDLNNFSDKEIDELSLKIGAKVAEKINFAIAEAQKILGIYGMDISFTYKLHPIGQPNYVRPETLPPDEGDEVKMDALEKEVDELSLKEDQEAVVVKKRRGRPKKVKTDT